MAVLLLLSRLTVRAATGTVPEGAWCPTDVGPDTGKLTRVALPAHCLDGSLAGYYDSGFEVGQSCLVVFLEGGNICVNVKECEATLRDAEINNTTHSKVKVSSVLDNTTMDGKSVLAANHPDLGCCRRVYVPYCSQDLFTSSAQTVLPSGRTLFTEGHMIFTGVFDSLELHTPGGISATYTRAVLAGASAGAVAAIMLVNSLADRFWPNSTNGRLHLLADSGWFIQPPLRQSDDAESVFTFRIQQALQDDALWKNSDIIEAICPLRPISLLCFQVEYMSTQLKVPALFLNSVQVSTEGNRRPVEPNYGFLMVLTIATVHACCLVHLGMFVIYATCNEASKTLYLAPRSRRATPIHVMTATCPGFFLLVG